MSLDYTLCKRLKDSGFPQKSGDVWYFLEEKSIQNRKTKDWFKRQAQWKFFHHLNPQNLKNEWYSCPTLEELIEACGDIEFGLSRCIKGTKKWQAGDMGDCQKEGEWDFMGEGSTPSEAVANLFLSLNEK